VLSRKGEGFSTCCVIGVFANRTNCSAQSSHVPGKAAPSHRLHVDRRRPVRHHRDDYHRSFARITMAMMPVSATLAPALEPRATASFRGLPTDGECPQSRAAPHELGGRHFDDNRFRAGVVHRLKPVRGIADERVAEGLACVEGQLLRSSG
jgi:hypothetical protein